MAGIKEIEPDSAHACRAKMRQQSQAEPRKILHNMRHKKLIMKVIKHWKEIFLNLV